MLLRNVSLKNLNTFGFDVNADIWFAFNSEDQLRSLWKTNLLNRSSPLVLGGGSNIVFTQNYPGIVLKNCFSGYRIDREDSNHVWLEVGGGENWHNLVMHAVNEGWGGIENLSLIPGTVGAAPIQNIGAYGAELKDVFYKLNAFDLQEGKMTTFSLEDCRFGYRDSVFKNEGKGRYIICSVTLKLNKKPEVNIKYGDISSVLENWNIKNPGIADVSRAIIHIRQSKLPDPLVLGNCGSFFKNPVVSNEIAEKISQNHPDLKRFDAGPGLTKLPAAWLIEKAGWKGFRRGDAGVHEKQALVLVNYGNAHGNDIFQLACEIQSDVLLKFGVALEMEVNIR
jgi:UDP-N-acetylmuramate dehydrogenase